MDSQIQYRRMKHGDEEKASVFVAEVFGQFVAPGYAQAGIDEFMKYIAPEALSNQLAENHFALIAALAAEIIGIIEIRNHKHIALFFVDGRHQRKGVGRALLEKALEICSRKDLQRSRMTVNASPNSQSAYQRMGFAPTDIEQCVNGIRSVPMVMGEIGV